jgi:hypothetical protein
MSERWNTAWNGRRSKWDNTGAMAVAGLHYADNDQLYTYWFVNSYFVC